MFGGVNPKQMQGMMKKMGISQEEIDSIKVTIEKTDGSKIIINEPQVTKIKMQGQETFQIAGEILEEESNEEDIETIMQKTGCSREEATESLKKTGDLAESILELS